MTAFLVVEAAKCSLFSPTMFQTFRRLLYHWHDVRSACGRFGAALGAITGFLDFCRIEKGLSANSLDAYSSDLAKFIAFAEGLPGFPGRTNCAFISIIYTSPGWSSRSVARHLTTLRNFYGFLLREERSRRDPTEHLRSPTAVADDS